MLELGLSRISKLTAGSKLPWKAIHVAGTNGKGTVCAYASSMLAAAGVRHGRFTSPHLIDRWDCISINGQCIDHKSYFALERKIRTRNESQNIRATEFEELTAIAFQAFTRAGVQIGVVEVGLGGRFDATNILEDPLSTVITKIGHDHEALLGKTLEDIAYQKAGILKSGVPCFVDGSNSPSVQDVISTCAEEVGAGPVTFVDPNQSVYNEQLWKDLPLTKYASHQRMNIALAFEATKSALSAIGIPCPSDQLASAIEETSWAGRLQLTSIERVTSRKEEVLLDGAHNPQAAALLGSYVDQHIRHGPVPVTWLLAMTEGKSAVEMLSHMLREGDNLITVAFGPVDGMPWVQAIDPHQLLEKASMAIKLQSSKAEENVELALKVAADTAKGRPLVIAGSLYLVSDVLRLLRDGSKRNA